MDPDTNSSALSRWGLNKPIHFTDFESSVSDIMNITAMAMISMRDDKRKEVK